MADSQDRRRDQSPEPSPGGPRSTRPPADAPRADGPARPPATRPGPREAPPPLPSATAALGTHDEPPEATHLVPRRPAAPRPGPAAAAPRPAAAAPPVADPRLGTTLGSYRLLEVLGRGGMGVVYRAEHVDLARPAAIKLLREEYARRPDTLERFRREAIAVNRIRHRNIVDVTDIARAPDGTVFIVMELLEGVSLTRWLRGGFSVARALALLIQVCDGLEAAHSVGVIHRDLKPDNIFVVATREAAETIKLLDFGVCKLVQRDDDALGYETQAGSLIGTPAYMSPEQAGGSAVDPRSDIYTLGAIMYEAFCGQPVFRGRSFGEYVRKHLTEEPRSPRATPGGATLDDRLEAIILRCLRKAPDQRYPSVVELRDDLQLLLGGLHTQHAEEPLPRRATARDPERGPAGAGRRAGPSAPGLATPAAAPAAGGAVATPLHARSTAALTGAAPPEAAEAQPLADPPPRRGRALAAAALAVAVAAAGAWVVAARGAEPSRSAAPVPSRGAEPPGRGRTVVRFESDPGGASVVPAGAASPACTTPCELAIDPSDGGSPTRRDFVLRAAGHADHPVAVPLGRPLERSTVILVPLPAAADAGVPVAASPDADEPAAAPPPAPSPSPRSGAGRRAGGGRGAPGPGARPSRAGDAKIDKSTTMDPFE